MNWLTPRLTSDEPVSHSGGLGLHAALASDPPWDSSVFCRPRYHCREEAGALKLVIHLPGADPSGIDLELAGPDLTVTAPKMGPTSSKNPFGIRAAPATITNCGCGWDSTSITRRSRPTCAPES